MQCDLIGLKCQTSWTVICKSQRVVTLFMANLQKNALSDLEQEKLKNQLEGQSLGIIY